MKKQAPSSNLTNKEIEELNKLYPIKLSPYLIEQSERSKYIKKQFFPSIEEFDTDIVTKEPFKGLLEVNNDFFERLYEDRVVLKLTSICPSYCRFCYRRSYVFGKEINIKDAEIEQALELCKQNKDIRTILLTGGFPLLLGTKKLNKIFKKIAVLDSIEQIYIALGRPIMNPYLITDEFAELLARFNANYKFNIACTVHINHYDELTKEVIEVLNLLTKRGITVWTQSTLLKGVNDNEETLTKMFSAFRQINLIPYYLIHAMPLIGASHFRTSIEKGIKLMKFLEQFSGHERPIFIVIPTVGKVQLVGNSKVDHKIIDGKKYAILHTPYKAEKFMAVNKLKALPENHYIDEDGYIVALYLDGKD